MHGGTGRSKAVKQLPATEGHPAVWGIHVATEEEQARGSLPPLARQKFDAFGSYCYRASGVSGSALRPKSKAVCQLAKLCWRRL